MIPKNRPSFAHNLAQKAKLAEQRAPGFKPVVAQLKTVAAAQNAKLPPQSVRVLQAGRQVGPTPVIMRKPARAVAPPVYKPQPAPKVMQQKSAAVPRKPLPPGAMQLKAQPARPANMPVYAATTRPRVVQMAAEVKPTGKKITAAGLKADDYLFVEAAGGGDSKAPTSTESKMKVLILRKSDVDYKLTATVIDAVLNNPTASRNSESDCPVHKNEQGRLPTYTGAKTQPNLEYVVKGLGGSRIVVDVAGRTVYLSHHYGDAAARQKKIPEKFANVSAFVELDPASWDLRAILVDARTWWDSAFHDPPGH